jgi:hypothetical protein
MGSLESPRNGRAAGTAVIPLRVQIGEYVGYAFYAHYGPGDMCANV